MAIDRNHITHTVHIRNVTAVLTETALTGGAYRGPLNWLRGATRNQVRIAFFDEVDDKNVNSLLAIHGCQDDLEVTIAWNDSPARTIQLVGPKIVQITTEPLSVGDSLECVVATVEYDEVQIVKT